jgi:hypothetical protein
MQIPIEEDKVLTVNQLAKGFKNLDPGTSET